MKKYFYITYDCLNLSEQHGHCVGRRFLSQQMMDNEISSAHHRGTVNSELPLYIAGNEMILDQLYRTKKFGNANCCALYVIVTTDPGELQHDQYYRFNIDRKMVDEMFGKTNTHDAECRCFL